MQSSDGAHNKHISAVFQSTDSPRKFSANATRNIVATENMLSRENQRSLITKPSQTEALKH